MGEQKDLYALGSISVAVGPIPRRVRESGSLYGGSQPLCLLLLLHLSTARQSSLPPDSKTCHPPQGETPIGFSTSIKLGNFSSLPPSENPLLGMFENCSCFGGKIFLGLNPEMSMSRCPFWPIVLGCMETCP